MYKKGEMNESPFEMIGLSEILLGEDINSLLPLKDELKEGFKKSQVFRTRTEMEISVLNDIAFPTPGSKYWQAMREQNVMFNELVSISYEYRKKKIEIKKIERDIVGIDDELDIEYKKIEIEKNNFELRQMEKVARDRIREIKEWSRIKEREALKMGKEELENVDNHQLISYTLRWINQIIANKGNNNLGFSEINNIKGQLQSGWNLCVEKGLAEKILNKIKKEDTLFLGLQNALSMDDSTTD